MRELGLGAYLIEEGVLRREQLAEALELQAVYGGRLGTNLVELGILSLDEVAEHLAASTGHPLPPKAWLDAPQPAALAALPRALLERLGALPLRLDADGLHVALLEPADTRACETLARAAGRPVRAYVLPELRLHYALERHLGIDRALRFVNLQRRLESGDATGPVADAVREAAALPPTGSPAHLETLLARCGDRDAAVRLALALARRHVRAAALFLVHRGMVLGVAGAGDGLERRAAGILVPIDAESAFAHVATSGASFRGAPQAAGLDTRVLRALGRSSVRELVLLPVVVRGRVVNLLYADDGAEPLAETALGALQAVAGLTARAYERLIEAHLGGSGTGEPSPGLVQVPAA